MPSLRDMATIVRQRYPEDADAIELEHAAAGVCASARDLVDAIDTAAREESVYRFMVAALADPGRQEGPDGDDEIRQAGDDAVSQGEIADAAAREAESAGRELAMKILRHADA